MVDREVLTEAFSTFEERVKAEQDDDESTEIMGTPIEDIEGSKESGMGQTPTKAYDQDMDLYLDALAYIVEHGPITDSQLASELGEPGYKTRYVIQVLAQRELIDREEGESEASEALVDEIRNVT
jgi:predicted transcriptional regulator